MNLLVEAHYLHTSGKVTLYFGWQVRHTSCKYISQVKLRVLVFDELIREPLLDLKPLIACLGRGSQRRQNCRLDVAVSRYTDADENDQDDGRPDEEV